MFIVYRLTPWQSLETPLAKNCKKYFVREYFYLYEKRFDTIIQLRSLDDDNELIIYIHRGSTKRPVQGDNIQRQIQGGQYKGQYKGDSIQRGTYMVVSTYFFLFIIFLMIFIYDVRLFEYLSPYIKIIQD